MVAHIHLPTDVVDVIIQHLGNTDHAREALMNVSTVHTSWLHPARKLLFRRRIVSSNSEFLQHGAALASFVRELIIILRRDEDSTWVYTLPRMFEEVTSIAIDDNWIPVDSNSQTLVFMAIIGSLNIRSLKIQTFGAHSWLWHTDAAPIHNLALTCLDLGSDGPNTAPFLEALLCSSSAHTLLSISQEFRYLEQSTSHDGPPCVRALSKFSNLKSLMLSWHNWMEPGEDMALELYIATHEHLEQLTITFSPEIYVNMLKYLFRVADLPYLRDLTLRIHNVHPGSTACGFFGRSNPHDAEVVDRKIPTLSDVLVPRLNRLVVELSHVELAAPPDLQQFVAFVGAPIPNGETIVIPSIKDDFKAESRS